VFERFTDRARRVLRFAQEEACLLNHPFIGTEHILLGLIREGEGVGAQALAALGISGEAVREKVEEAVGMAGTSPTGLPPFTPRAKKVLELALREALQLNHSYIGTEHLLLGLVREGEGLATVVLAGLGADPARIRQEVMKLVSGGQDPQSGGQGGDLRDTRTPRSPAAEPRCPECRRSMGGGAHYRTISVPSDSGDGDPMSVVVVYCRQCGTTLRMAKGEDSSSTSG
jgi:ATP-dependent Clp protease ATP-binding subunit ClpC